jgi:hypothetical protein
MLTKPSEELADHLKVGRISGIKQKTVSHALKADKMLHVGQSKKSRVVTKATEKRRC